MEKDLQIILEGLGDYAVPILTKGKGTQSPALVGTGTLYRSGPETFLITAKHVVDELNNGFIITSGSTGFIRFRGEMAAFKYNQGVSK